MRSSSPVGVSVGVRPRDGFSVTRPQHAAGYRSDPPASPPLATDTMPDATADAEPPLDPPGVRVRSQGLRVAPNARGSVVAPLDSSGTFVLPTITNPAHSNRCVSSVVRVER